MENLNDSKTLAIRIAKILDKKKAQQIRVLKVQDLTVLTDYFVIASASNINQLQALVDNVEEVLYKAGYPCRQKEGNSSSTWVLMDYSDVIIHVFSKEDRLFYDLERIWRDGKVLESVDELGEEGKTETPSSGSDQE